MVVKNADTFIKRFKGLMFVDEFDYVLKFRSNGIHTFFMKVNIDVVLTDKDNIILYVYRNLKPFRVILPKTGVKYTYEMPTNYIKNIKVGEKLEL